MSSPLDGIPPDVREELNYFLDPFHLGAIHHDRLSAEEAVDFVREKFEMARQKLESEGLDVWLEWHSELRLRAAGVLRHQLEQGVTIPVKVTAPEVQGRPSFPAQRPGGNPPRQGRAVIPQRSASGARVPALSDEDSEEPRPPLPGTHLPYPGWDSAGGDPEWLSAVWDAKLLAPKSTEPERYEPFTLARVIRWLAVYQVRSPLLPEWSVPLGESLSLLKNRRILRNRMRILDLAVRLTSDPERRTAYRVDPRKGGPSISSALSDAIAAQLAADAREDPAVKALSSSRVRAVLKDNEFQTPPGLVFSTSFTATALADEEE